MEVWKINFLSKCVICSFHVNLPGCVCLDPPRVVKFQPPGSAFLVDKGAEISLSWAIQVYTPLKFNMDPENGGLEDDFPFQLGDS